MRGLDPRIHHFFQDKMDCRVKPGNDDALACRGLAHSNSAIFSSSLIALSGASGSASCGCFAAG